MTLTKRYRFSASHRLDTPSLTIEQNRALYGKCNNPYGHGHDYVLDVSVEGTPDASGQIVKRDALDAVVHKQVLERLDHRNLNVDVPELGGVPTTENLAAFIKESLSAGWTLPGRIARVRISETERNIVELRT